MVMEANTPPDVAQKMDTDDLDLPAEQVVVAYHERTKHHYHRYAASLGYMDWAKQVRAASRAWSRISWVSIPVICAVIGRLRQ